MITISEATIKDIKVIREIAFKTWYINNSGLATPVINTWPGINDSTNAPRQILPQTFYQDGYVDIFPLQTIFKFNSTSGNRVMPFLIEDFSVDIDTLEDMNLINEYLNDHELPKWFNLPHKK
jgi:hypothetical protein